MHPRTGLLRSFVILAVSAWLFLAATLTFAVKNPPLAFLHVNVVPMNKDGVLEDQTVIVRDGRIEQVGPASAVRVPRGARVVDGKGKYLIPGLCDAHVHLQTTTEFPLYLANGVTTVFNLNGRPAHLLWRKQIADGDLQGPTIFTTGPTFDRAHTAAEAVRMVDEQAALGYDGVKIYNQVSKAEYPALIAEAKRKGMLLMGHIAREPDFELTLASGQSIAHLEEFTYTYFNPLRDGKNSHIVFDESKIPEAVLLAAEAHVSVIPTLFTYATIVQQATELGQFLQRPDLKYDSPWILAGLQPAANRYKNGFTSDFYPRIRASLALQRKLVKALEDAGVPLMAGTDASDVGPVAGFGLHDELQEFVNDGLTPFQALQTATVNSAQYFHQSQEFGTIEAGKRADLVLLEGNPLADISNTRKIAGVAVRGRWLDHQEQMTMMNAVPATYQRQIAQVQHDLETNPARAQRYLDENDPLDNLASEALAGLVTKEGAEKLRLVVLNIRRSDPKSAIVAEEKINGLGYALLGLKKYSQAIAVFRMNTEDFPRSANCYDSYAEALFNSGKVPDAVANYKKALDVDSKYPNAEFATKFVAEHGKAN
jgi:imidazolonepropionase-like amidohydrolase